MVDVTAASDRDDLAVREATRLAERAKQAQQRLTELTQAQIDAIVGAMAGVAADQAEPLAAAAVQETGYGVVADKVQKNLFAARTVYDFIRPMATVGVIARHDDRRVVEIAEPFGVVAAIVPSTNPTSTAIYKLLIAIKARCAIVVSPHPAAVGSITRTVELMSRAATSAGLPNGAIGCMTTVTLAGTQALMKRREIALILSTGGLGLVRAAYSAGKPAYGVGPGNAPAYIERSADVPKAVDDIMTGKTFDNGVLCSAENAVVVDAAIADDVRRAFQAAGGHFMSTSESARVAAALVTPQRLPNPALVGKSAVEIAQQAGIDVPPETRVLIAPLTGVGRDHPLSIEKLCPVLAFYVVDDWRAGCERCKEILGYGGLGHTMAIHSRDDAIVLEFGLKKPAFRIVVNTPTTLGSIGLTTGLEPAMTLGCGGHGGNITSDNITPRHLLNIKRVAYGIRQAPRPDATGAAAPRHLPAAPRHHAAPAALDPHALATRIDAFLAARGTRVPATRRTTLSKPAQPSRMPIPSPTLPAPPVIPSPTPPATPAAFVCEADVRAAIDEERSILIDDRTIVTPSARDLGTTRGVLVETGLTGR